MAYIKVDCSKIKAAQIEVDGYLALLKREMKNANGQVKLLGSSWSGSDFSQFKAKWDGVDDSGSTYYNMVKALESYSTYLKLAQQLYEKAQKNALQRANSLR